MNKKGQISIFIILGVVILFSFMLLSFVSIKYSNLNLINNSIQKGNSVTDRGSDQSGSGLDDSLSQTKLDNPGNSILSISLRVGVPFTIIFIIVGLIYLSLIKQNTALLIVYINNALLLGFVIEEIIRNLEKVGWNKKQIDRAFKKLLEEKRGL